LRRERNCVAMIAAVCWVPKGAKAEANLFALGSEEDEDEDGCRLCSSKFDYLDSSE
jgi:hypothetical protein